MLSASATRGVCDMSAARLTIGRTLHLLGCSAGVLLALGLTGCGKPKPPAPAMREAGYVTLSAQAVTLTTELSGRTNPYAVAEVRPQINGIIKARLFKEGATVKAGDALYQID